MSILSHVYTTLKFETTSSKIFEEIENSGKYAQKSVTSGMYFFPTDSSDLKGSYQIHRTRSGMSITARSVVFCCLVSISEYN